MRFCLAVLAALLWRGIALRPQTAMTSMSPAVMKKGGLRLVDFSVVQELVDQVMPGSRPISALQSGDKHTRGLRAVDERGGSTIWLMNDRDTLDDDDRDDDDDGDGAASACAVLDELLLDHLRSPGHRIHDVRGYAVGGASARAVLQSRGFFADSRSAEDDEEEDVISASPSPRLRFDEHRGAHSLTCAAACDGDPECAPVELLERLCPSPPDAARASVKNSNSIKRGLSSQIASLK